ncbi:MULTISPECIES: hypothetical protein [Bacillales]|uniref:Xanthine/uracil permease n=1 Tax=Anoxybacillus andreesenii TaxID=1325932 RepID=A0ABT9UZJ6_9BACL|nr:MULTISPECIES: hypothetical protein [Bacillaceae]MDQ0154121.1 xanthine/uracil permease [Robertmurraya andreesenii]
MGEFWRSLSWDLRVLIVVAGILSVLIFFSFLDPDKNSSFASSLVFLTIGVITIMVSSKPTLQDSSTTFAATIIGSFVIVLVILPIIPNVDYWAEILSLSGLLVAVLISLTRNLIYVYQERRYDVYGQRDIRRRMLKWANTDRFAHLTEQEANQIREFLDQHNIE